MAMDKRQVNLMKQVATVFGAITFGWITVELAFRPILEKFRAAMDKADPSIDPDDVPDVSAADAAAFAAVVAADLSYSDDDREKSEDLAKPDGGDAITAAAAANDQ